MKHVEERGEKGKKWGCIFPQSQGKGSEGIWLRQTCLPKWEGKLSGIEAISLNSLSSQSADFYLHIWCLFLFCAVSVVFSSFLLKVDVQWIQVIDTCFDRSHLEWLALCWSKRKVKGWRDTFMFKELGIIPKIPLVCIHNRERERLKNTFVPMPSNIKCILLCCAWELWDRGNSKPVPTIFHLWNRVQKDQSKRMKLRSSSADW